MRAPLFVALMAIAGWLLALPTVVEPYAIRQEEEVSSSSKDSKHDVVCCRDPSGNPYGLYDGSVCGSNNSGSNNQEILIQYTAEGVTWYNEDVQCGNTNPLTTFSSSENTFRGTISLDYGTDQCVGGDFIMNLESDRLALMDWFQDNGVVCSDNAFVILCDACEVPEDDKACFSERALVSVQGKESGVAMKDLKVGDWVLVADQNYEPVYAFGHYHPSKEQSFLQIHYTSSEKEEPLEITKDHLIFLKDHPNPVRADSIQLGDELALPASSSAAAASALVTKIKTVSRKGVYTPLTPSGTVVVNGIVASSYISLAKTSSRMDGQDQEQDHYRNEFMFFLDGALKMSHQNYVHMTLAPLRLFCQGIAPGVCQQKQDSFMFYNDDGLPHYIALGLRVHEWIMRENNNGGFVDTLVQAMFFGLVGLFMGTCWILEVALGGAAMAPLTILLIFPVMVYAWQKNRLNKAQP